MFFAKKNQRKIHDTVWMTQNAKWNGILEEWKKDNNLSVICWFESTMQKLEALFGRETSRPVSLFLASQMHTALIADNKILFAEHYPLVSKESKLFEKLSLKEVTIYSALDEPVFLHFGGDKIINMMKQMGMKEDQGIQHKLISGAIVKVQDKIEKKVPNEILCHSPEEWLGQNLGD